MKAWKLRSYTHPSFGYLFCHAQSFVNQNKWGRRPKNGEAKKFLARKSVLFPVLNFSHVALGSIHFYLRCDDQNVPGGLLFGVFVDSTIICNQFVMFHVVAYSCSNLF